MSDLVERLRDWTTDWNGDWMKDGEPPRDGLHCDILREAAAEIERLRKRLILLECAAKDAGFFVAFSDGSRAHQQTEKGE